jgi:hypothetical protein
MTKSVRSRRTFPTIKLDGFPKLEEHFCSSLRRLLCTVDKKEERDVCHYVEINVVCNFLCKLKHNNLPIPNKQKVVIMFTVLSLCVLH